VPGLAMSGCVPTATFLPKSLCHSPLLRGQNGLRSVGMSVALAK
jgi:hypothetical protein